MTIALSVCGSVVAAAPDDAVVNERPPVTRAQLEASWGVDCASAAQELSLLLKNNPLQLEALVSLTESILLCAHLDRMNERDPMPFVHLSGHLDDLLACHESGDGSCHEYRQSMLEILLRLDVDQGRNP